MSKKLMCFVLACLFALCMATASQAQDPHNVAVMGTATSSSTDWGWLAHMAIDGDIGTGSHSTADDPDKWLEIELDQVYTLNAIEVVNRESCCWERIATVVVKALDADRNEIYVSDPIAEADALQGSVHVFDNGGAGFADVAYIRLEGGTDFLQIMEVRAMIDVPYAWAPIPADGEIEVDTASLEWTLGDTAVSSKVYLSTDATIDDADLLGETTLNLQVVTLDPGATYYWRVDETDADGNVFAGDVWSFTTLPLAAHFPSPADGGTNAVSALLSWTAGKDAIMHNVHFGTDPAVLLPVAMMQMDTSFDPGALELETTYYWRVDEFAGAATNAGPVWSFSTAPLIPSADIPDLEAWYTLDQDASSIGVLDMSGNNRHGSIQGDPQWVDGQAGSALEFDGSGDYVNIDGYKGILAVDGVQQAFTVANWFKTTGNGEMVTWGVNGTATRLTWRIDGGSLRTEHNAGNLRGNTIVNDGEWHHGALVVTEGANLRTPATLLYIDGAPDTTFSGNDNAYNLTEGPDVSIGRRADNNSRHFPGTIDDVRIYSRTLETMEIRVLAGVEELPYGPAPADGEIDLSVTAVVLTWNPAEGAVEQDVYFGTDEAVVATADASDTTGIYAGRQAETDSAQADLSRGVTYFWRVDGVKADGTVMPGTVWNFRIADPHTDNWAAGVGSAEPAYLDTYVQNGAYDIGALSGDISYEFIVNSNPDETQASMALIGRIGHGDTTVALKYEQWNNTGLYGATVFGVADHDFGVATAPGEYTHLAFVSSEDAGTTDLYVNGALEGSVSTAITLSGIVGIGQAIRDPEGVGSIDNFDGTIFGVAIYDRALTADEIVANADKYFSPIPITDPDLMVYFDFESGEGNVVIDQSGHSNHGTIIGAAWVGGLEGTALDMAGVGYVDVPAQSWSTIENQMTIAFWAYGDPELMPQSHTVFAAYSDPGNNEARIASAHIPWGNGNVYFDTGGTPTSGGYDRIFKEASPEEYAGSWRHWTFLKNAETGEQQIYLDGVLWQSGADLIRPMAGVTAFTIGARNDGGEIYPGMIDDFRLYNRTLTGMEILKLAQPQLADVTAPGDNIQGVPNDGLMDGDNFGWPGAETPDLAIDDNTGTKFLHFKGEIEPTGFQVEPAMGATIVTGLTFTTANDAVERDPVTFEFSGSNDSMDGPYELIASGDIADFAMETAWPRFTMNATAISFANEAAYKYYQVMFPTVRDAGSANSMQIAEVELLGVPAPVAHWMLDDGAGTVALDATGNGNDGALEGDPQWVEGIIGGALEFNGDDWVDCGDVLTMTEALTITCWVNPAGLDGDNGWVTRQGAYAFKSNGLSLRFTTPGIKDYNVGNTTLVIGEWQHAAVTFVPDQAEGAIFYLNGVEAQRIDSTALDAGDGPFRIGNNQWDQFYEGQIDDVRIYNQVLSAGQIRKIANP